jgi:putative component of membrane protein insertase Oxa1/YidC/SpoIIIJ protein YidD
MAQIKAIGRHMRFPFSVIIKAYQRGIGPIKGATCPMHPTCSFYAQEAIRKHNFIGALQGIDRIHRCAHDLHHYPTIVIEEEIKYYDPVK